MKDIRARFTIDKKYVATMTEVINSAANAGHDTTAQLVFDVVSVLNTVRGEFLSVHSMLKVDRFENSVLEYGSRRKEVMETLDCLKETVICIKQIINVANKAIQGIDEDKIQFAISPESSIYQSASEYKRCMRNLYGECMRCVDSLILGMHLLEANTIIANIKDETIPGDPNQKLHDATVDHLLELTSIPSVYDEMLDARMDVTMERISTFTNYTTGKFIYTLTGIFANRQ